MISVDFTGRLGNQMFTYAFARKLIELENTAEHQSFIANFKRCGSSEAEGWGDSLKYFNTLPYATETADCIIKHGTMLQRSLYLAYVLCCKTPLIRRNNNFISAIEHRLRKHGIHFTGAADAAYAVKQPTNRITFIRGYFQDKHFFDDMRPVLLQEFTPKQPPLARNAQLYDVISQPNTVCVSVRRGDFLSHEYKSNFYVCTPDYYQRAILSICKQIDNPIFIFFSDDIDWVCNNMRVDDYQCYYERGDDPLWEKLRLMYSCHHFIIPNSTFAWWAQYLGQRRGKIVICPDRWFANPEWHSNLINDDFQFVKTKFS